MRKKFLLSFLLVISIFAMYAQDVHPKQEKTSLSIGITDTHLFFKTDEEHFQTNLAPTLFFEAKKFDSKLMYEVLYNSLQAELILKFKHEFELSFFAEKKLSHRENYASISFGKKFLWNKIHITPFVEYGTNFEENIPAVGITLFAPLGKLF